MNSLHPLPGVGEGFDPYRPERAPVPEYLRRAVQHALRLDVGRFYCLAARLSGTPLVLRETRTGDFTGPCPLPSHPPAALARRQRPLRVFHGRMGGGWRCSVCGQGNAVQFLSRLFFLPLENGESAGWNLAATLAGVDPDQIRPADWKPWDSARAHLEWGTAVSYTRANLDWVRPFYLSRFPNWRDSEILQFPSTGRGTMLVAYRVRGRLTQLEEMDLSRRTERRVRFHHWSRERRSALARAVAGVYPDTPGLLKKPAGEPGLGGESVDSFHLVQGPEHAASARALLRTRVAGTPYGPVSLGQAEIDALAQFSRVHVWADNDPAGHGYQNQAVRLLRQCGINAQPVRWPETGDVPTGYTLTDFLQDGGTMGSGPDGRLSLHLPAKTYRQAEIPLAG